MFHTSYLYKALGTEMLENFFHPNIQSRMVQLENSALRKKCANELGNIAMSSAGNMIPDNSLSQLQKVNVIICSSINFNFQPDYYFF